MDIIAYGSRIANMPAVNTIKAALTGFSDKKAVVIRTRGRDVSVVTDSNGRLTTMAKTLIFDNVQHFRLQRELRVGRENSMIIGIAATFIEFRVDLEALDPLSHSNKISVYPRSQRNVFGEDDGWSFIAQNTVELRK